MKRLLKIFLLALLGLVILVSGLAIFLRLQYPAARVKEILLATLAQRYGVTATCERLTLNLFSGFVLEKIKLIEVRGQAPAVPPDFRSPLAVERIDFSYRWRSLLARKLEIDAITIIQPTLRYWQAPDSATNLDAWLAAFTDSAAAADTAALPFAIQLRKIRVENLAAKAELISMADTQQIALDHFNAEITQLELDRRARYRARFKFFAEPGGVAYRLRPRAGAASQLTGSLPVQIDGAWEQDSLSARFDISWREAQWLSNDQQLALPAGSLNAALQYDFASGALHLPAIMLKLDEAVDFAGSFSMRTQPDTSFDVRVQRGRFDLGRITGFLQAHRHLDALAALQRWRAAGTLAITGSDLRWNQTGWQYRAALAGENIFIADSISNFEIAGANLQLEGNTFRENFPEDFPGLEAEWTDLSCRLNFARCSLPLAPKAVLPAGPAQLRAHVILTPAYAPHRGELDLNWQNFSGGRLHGRASLAARDSSAASPRDFKTFLHLEADSLELTPLTGRQVAGRLLHAELKIEGERLDALRLTASLRHDSLVYFTSESFGKIPPHHARLSSQLKTDAAFSRFSFSAGNWQSGIAAGAFQGYYHADRGFLRFELPQAHVSITDIMTLLPQDLIADSTFPHIAGTAQARGWFESSASPEGELKYEGKFFAQSRDGVYADTLSGVFADNLQIESEWSLAVDSTMGEFRATCPALRLDYLPAPLPPAQATGKLIVFENHFVIKAGEMEIPKWSIAGKYEVAGKFLPAGMQVTTVVSAGLNAPQKLALSPATSIQGNLHARFILEQYLPDDLAAPQPARLAGSLEIAHFNLEQDSTLALRDLNAHLSLAQEFDLLDLSLPPAAPEKPFVIANAAEKLLLDDVFRRKGNGASSPSRLTLAELQIGRYRLSDIAADLALGEGRLEATQLRMNLLGGNLLGNVLIGLGDGNPDNITYSISVQASSLDASHLRRLGEQVGAGSKLSADFFLHGRGASPQKLDENLAQLLGALNISQIESRAASNLLQALDPRGTDVGVQRMRLLLKTGWNIKTMKFEIKNGFVYASVSLIKTKPWTALFNLPPKLDFARFPLRYFMQTPDQ